MPALRKTFDPIGFLPDDIRAAIRRRLHELGGLVLLGLALLLIAALATWSVEDPSLNHATSAPARNLLGVPGAVISDLLMQLFGLAAIVVVIPVTFWGWRLLTHRPLDREALRLFLWIVGVVTAAGALSALPVAARWPLPVGLGGVAGDVMGRVPVALAGVGAGHVFGGLMFAAAAIGALIVACGFGFHRVPDPGSHRGPAPRRRAHVVTQDESPAMISLGALHHAFLSAKARIAARFTEPEDDMPVRRAVPRMAAEPVPVEKPAPRAKPAGKRVEPVFTPPRNPVVPVPAPHLAPEPDEADPQDDDFIDEEPAPAPPPRKAVPVEQPAPRPVAKAAAAPAPALKRGKGRGAVADDAEADYELPPLRLLADVKPSDRQKLTIEQIQENAATLEGVLEDFGVRGEIVNARPGPVVTLYELEPAPGIKSSRVIGLADDIARSMSAVSARVAVVPGRNAIGIELPNPKREKVLLRELLATSDYANASAKLPLCLGKTIGGEATIVDLARMPHLLIAGTTGSGKSVAINTMILSLLYRLKPSECRLIMVDPKMLELSVYDGIPHLLSPVVTDPKKAVVALKWAVREMEDRYRKMSKLGVRNIDGFNARVAEAKARGEVLTRTVQTGFDKETGEAIYEEEQLGAEPLPYIVVIVDEMADLMMVAGKEIEGAIQRLAQMARAAGIHVVLATQRPSVDVITGTIKANFPTRISFQVTSKIDSRTILGEQGAEQLLGQGDMLYMAGGGRISRVHGPFCSDEEVEKVVKHLKAQGTPSYLEEVTRDDEPAEAEDGAVFDATAMGAEGGGDLYSQAVAVVMRDRKASTSYIQRRLQIGYNRAASLMERMENEGIVGPANHAGKREILVGEAED
jgi:S-DNA-T family DNA segregation ATPase FtsK/SpoIIIE